MPPPLGTLVHSLGHNWLGKADIAVQTILLAAALVAVGLRLWSRRLQRVSLRGNDWLLLAGVVVMVGRYTVELSLILLCGLGLHASEVNSIGGPEAFVRFDELTYAGDLLWITVVALVQLSILDYYLCRFQHRIIMWLIYGLLGLCSALWIASVFATAFFCSPPKKIWLPDTDGHCGNRKLLHTSCSVTTVILNGLILLLPLPMIRHMQMSRARKIAVCGIYVLGLVILGVSISRIIVEFKLNPEDPTYGSTRKSLLSSIIPLLGIIVACLPIIPPAIEKLSGSTLFSSTADGHTPVSPGYWKTTVLSGAQMEEPEIPLVTVAMPPMAKKLSELAHGQIKITSDWEIHSTRNSARLDRDSVRRG
ncbi:hypothetical protein N7462_011189 [Penicillium macrosclerotiorum]|uniref:uncharacterized protein n=1 Tax=Penicillium macrosclerotiorum TaxID=303699 RepID=UPI002546E23F|nr:uncharacterized protein N7462_011189 [Penicillium macrosclerotiorum]KAJ5666780.1 hypothetical protein N7462_011189 [Penicillium macrosclerotiorum]